MLATVLIVVGVIAVLAVLGGLLIWRPIRRRRQQELKEAKAAAQDDLIALSAGVTDHDADVSIRSNPEAAAEQAAALNAYERGTAALDAARSVKDMGAVSRAIAEGQYHLASARALAAGEPKPDRRPLCFFDPRHGMSVRDVLWTPPDGGPPRPVPACADDATPGGAGDRARDEDGGGPRGAGQLRERGLRPGVLGRLRVPPRHVHRVPARRGALPRLRLCDGYFGGDGVRAGDWGRRLRGRGLRRERGPRYGGDFGGGDFGGGDFGGGDFGGGGGDFS